MIGKNYEFTVTFTAKEGWVDEIFLGNMLAEMLGSMAKSTNAFSFDIKFLGHNEKPK
ncbi:MAG: hypothetical protein QXG05_04580 [Nitrososphaerota archaeon]